MNKSTIHHIIGELITMDKYRFVDHVLIGEIVNDVFDNLKLGKDIIICKKCGKIIHDSDTGIDDKNMCFECSIPF